MPEMTLDKHRGGLLMVVPGCPMICNSARISTETAVRLKGSFRLQTVGGTQLSELGSLREFQNADCPLKNTSVLPRPLKAGTRNNSAFISLAAENPTTNFATHAVFDAVVNQSPGRLT